MTTFSMSSCCHLLTEESDKFFPFLSVLHHNYSSGLCHSCTQNIAPVEGQTILVKPMPVASVNQAGQGDEGEQSPPVLLRSSSVFTSCMFLLERGGRNHPSFPKLSLKGKSSEKLKKFFSIKREKTKGRKNRGAQWILHELSFAPSEPSFHSEKICFLNIS